jgi:hypothetical protein
MRSVVWGFIRGMLKKFFSSSFFFFFLFFFEYIVASETICCVSQMRKATLSQTQSISAEASYFPRQLPHMLFPVYP